MKATDISIVELAGLPGTGKSTTSKFLKRKVGGQTLFLTRMYIGSKYKLLLSCPIIPYILIKFHRVFRTLLHAKITDANSEISLKTLLSIVAVLSSSIMEYWIALIESSIRRKKVFLDGGYIQWGLSVWLRTPPEIKADLWSAYLTHIPKNILCIILECEPHEALKRAKSREKGVPNVMYHRKWNSDHNNELEDQYQQMFNLLKNEDIQSRVICIYVKSDTDASKQADLICNDIERFIPLKKLAMH